MTTTVRPDLRPVTPGPTATAYRRLLAILPPGYRREHGDELLDVYLEAAAVGGRPSRLDRLDVARLAARTWARALFLPPVRDKERWWVGTVIGVLGLLSFGAGRVVGDAVLAVWRGMRDATTFSGKEWWDETWWSSAQGYFSTGPYAWHSDWPVWFLWAVALVLAIYLRRPTWAVAPAAVATGMAASTWLVAAGARVGFDRRYLVFAEWGPMVRAGWLVFQIAGFLVLVAAARRGSLLANRDTRRLRVLSGMSAGFGIATGSGMSLAWLLTSHDHWAGVVQLILAAYLGLIVILLVGTRIGRAVLPYAVLIGLVFVLPRALLLRTKVDHMAWGDPTFLPGPSTDFFADLTKPLALPRGWEALPFVMAVAVGAGALFFGVRALRARRSRSPVD